MSANPCTRDFVLFDVSDEYRGLDPHRVRRATRLGDDVPTEPWWELSVDPPIVVSYDVTTDRVIAGRASDPLRFLCDEWYDDCVRVRLSQPGLRYDGSGKLKRASTLGRDERLSVVLGMVEEYLASHHSADLSWEKEPDLRRLHRVTSRIAKDPETPAWAAQRLRDNGLWDCPDLLAAIETFARREGHLDVPSGHIESGVRVDLALEHYRNLIDADRKLGIRTVSADEVARLRALPGWRQP